MKVLCVGDVVGDAGVAFIQDRLMALKNACNADLVIVNGENADASGVGLSRDAAEQLLPFADVITTGNHCFRKANETMYLEQYNILHPANYPYTDDAGGCCNIDMGGKGTVKVINLAGVAFMEAIDNPFARADELLEKDPATFTVVDFHAESTAEKKALGFYLDGRVSAVFGTHTHVQTADEQILPGGTGFISDAGMTGPQTSVLGVEPAAAIHRQKRHTPVRFTVADGPCMLNAVLFELDRSSGRCVDVKRFIEYENNIKDIGKARR